MRRRVTGQPPAGFAWQNAESTIIKQRSIEAPQRPVPLRTGRKTRVGSNIAGRPGRTIPTPLWISA